MYHCFYCYCYCCCCCCCCYCYCYRPYAADIPEHITALVLYLPRGSVSTRPLHKRPDGGSKRRRRSLRWKSSM